MKGSVVFSVASKCFAPAAEDEYAELTAPEAWDAFIADLCDCIAPRSLYELLSEREVEALKNPPAYASYSAFCRRHFTGGLPASAVPVESIYRTRREAQEGERGSYHADSALYMGALIERLGLTLPPQYAACPDHLALELDMLAVLQRSGCDDEARSFLSERFDWLVDYRQQLLHLEDPESDFYIALVDILIDAVTGEGNEEADCDSASSGR